MKTNYIYLTFILILCHFNFVKVQSQVTPNILGKYLVGTPTFKTIASSTNQLDKPTDLDFHPIRTQELWIINERTESQGGSTVIVSDAGLSNQTAVSKIDGNSWHFMSLPTAIAFGPNGNWASSPGVFSANHDNTEFTGPTLWSGDLSVYAQYQGPGTNGSHLDNLYESPHSMGIAHDNDNAYWVFDGQNQDIVFYNFNLDHGPGQGSDNDGVIRRYETVDVARDATDPTIPSHLVLNKANDWLYIVDIGNDRVIRMNTTTGNVANALTGFQTISEYSEMTGVIQETVIDTGLVQPCGIDIVGDSMVISDYANGDIRFYDISITPALYLGKISTGAVGITGVKIGPEGNIWYTNRITNEVRKTEPQVAGKDTHVTCDSYLWIDGNTYVVSNNTATHLITGGASNGSDSLVILDLTINSISDLTTTINGLTITSNNANASYKWLDCDNGNTTIIGEIGQSFSATINGNYAVELTESGCKDTSACVSISSVGIIKNNFGNKFIVYPNPTDGNFSIDLGNNYENTIISITDLNGRVIDSEIYTNSQLLKLKLKEPKGIYLLTIESESKKALIRLVKE